MGYDIVWKLRDKEAFERSVILKFSNSEVLAKAVIDRFHSDIQLHPLEWPTSERPPSEHVWRCGEVMVRYRLTPASQQIQVLSVEPSGSASKSFI
jgi:hypothetical protein